MRPQYIKLTYILPIGRRVGDYSLAMFEAMADAYEACRAITGNPHPYELVI